MNIFVTVIILILCFQNLCNCGWLAHLIVTNFNIGIGQKLYCFYALICALASTLVTLNHIRPCKNFGTLKKIWRWIKKTVKSLGEEKKFFHHYLDLPPELRMMVIEQMQPKERCLFRRCSKLCDKEVRQAKNYIHQLAIWLEQPHYITLTIDYAPENGCRLTFINVGSRNVMKYLQRAVRGGVTQSVEQWRTELDSSIDVMSYAIEYFEKLLESHQNKIKSLKLDGRLFHESWDCDFGIKKLNNLECFSPSSISLALKLLPKLRRPLKTFQLRCFDSSTSISEIQQIYDVEEEIIMWNQTFTNQQFQRFKAQVVHINIGELTEHDLFNFINSWRHGTIGHKVKHYQWGDIEESDFDAGLLLRLFGVSHFVRGCCYEFKKIEEDGEVGIISYDLTLDFEVVPEHFLRT